MTTIGELSFDDTPSLSDSVPLFETASGVTVRTSIGLLLQALNQLPTVQPPIGSGQLWLNAGVVTVA